MKMSPKEVVKIWVQYFNAGNANKLASLYHDDAVNHQVTQPPVSGREAIQAMFEQEFSNAEMHCMIENLFEDGEWAILEWKDPLGLRGCGFFHIIDNRIIFQRGYWDKLTFLRKHSLPIPNQ